MTANRQNSTRSGTTPGAARLKRKAYNPMTMIADDVITDIQRLDDYIGVGLAHQRLAETARHAAVERERAANIESSVELLRAISSVLDIRTVFPRISEIANKALPHDRLTLMFHDRGGEILIEAAWPDEFPELNRLVKAGDPGPEEDFFIIDDLVTAKLSIVEPADLQDRLLAAGYRSVLVVLARARQPAMGLGF